MISSQKSPCPCHLGARYSECCESLHLGRSTAETPERLMRSRYSAFARGLGEYLVDTLAEAHPDRSEPRQALVASLSAAHETQRFAGLRIIHSACEGDTGEVLFVARVYTRGADTSFVELSTFKREAGAWRYASGQVLDRRHLPKDLSTLTRERFLEMIDPR
jgi:SEC-C motif domain protein